VITKTERAELRSVVRQQFRVLRAEVTQRKAELYADVEDQIADRFGADDRTWAGVMHEVHEAVLECNRRINDAFYRAGYQERGRSERMWIGEPNIRKPEGKRNELRHQAGSRIEAQVKGAMLNLDRREADLLRTLAIGAIESEEARAFLEALPTVGELVPAARLAELEASLGGDAE
jgi:hypothetical protein